MTALEDRVRELEAELASTSNERDMAALLAVLGSNLEALGQRDRAIETLRRAVTLLEDAGDASGLADSLNRLGAVLSEPYPDDARAVLERALEVATGATNRSEQATAHNNLAILDEIEDDFDAAQTHYVRALELLRLLDDPRKLAATLNNLAVLHHMRGDDDAAQAAWSEALSLLDPLGPTGTLASTHNNLGKLAAARGAAELAVAHYQVAVEIQETLGDVGELATILENVADALLDLNRPDDARLVLDRSRELRPR